MQKQAPEIPEYFQHYSPSLRASERVAGVADAFGLMAVSLWPMVEQ